MSQKYLGGYLADTTSFTTPASGDPQFNYVTALLHGDGTNGAQNNTFIDSSANSYTITRNGNPTQGTFSPYGSLWSNYFDGGSSLSISSSNTVLPTGTQDFCVEMWVNWVTQSGSYPQLISNPVTNGFQIYYDVSNGLLAVGIFNVANVITYTISQSTLNGVWNHIAVTRSGNTFRLFVNGVLQSNGTNTISYAAVSTQYVASDGSRPYTGYMSNVQTVLGSIPTAYQTSSTTNGTSVFTPSTTPLTAVSGTALLTCQSNRFLDNSANAFAITVNGSPSVQRFSPFNLTTAYSTSVIGGSMYTSGATGNYLSSTLNSSGLSLTGNMTIQGWMYVTTYTNEYVFAVGTGSYRIALQLYSSRAYVAYGDIYTYKSTTQTQYTYLSNSWHHFAIVRNSNDVRLYIDGVDQGSYGTIATNPTDYDLYVADGAAGAVPFYGYLSNIVFTQSAVYTAAFTPPTAPVSTGTVLLNFTNGGIYDNAEISVLETVGNAQVSTSVVKFGTGSMYFDGSGDYLTGVPSPVNALGGGNFTVEAWIYLLGYNGGWAIYSQLYSYTSPTAVLFYINASGNLKLNINGSETDFGSISLNTWHHVALVRSGSTITGYVDGTSGGSTSNSTNFSDQYLVIGRTAFSTASNYAYGYIDDLRITKGYARYTSNFTPPTAAFPNSYTPAVTTSIVPTASAAPGIWTMEQQAYYKAQGLWPTPPPPTPTVDYIVVAGGGGGGRYTSGGGCGGGGAGGFRTASSFAVSSGSALTVTVGAGGAAATNGAGTTGSNSVFSTITANGGGGGGSRDTANPGNGGSGGGAAANSSGFTKSGGTGNTPSTSPSQGNNGGNDPGPDTAPYLAAGGGGSSAVGADRGTGTGGAGTASSYSGSSVTYAGGGGGGSYSGTSAVSGGAGGGGSGGYDTTSATSGTANRGGGGGGSGNGGSSAAGTGGSGVVVIRYANTYPDASATTGSPTYANTGGYKIYTFTSSGTITF